ncbi:MAG: hypothetical protein CMB80_17125 [Flammeovirgaceae bacterium]|nr:hypothetical protein [Flammeovirgaceae bacterium]MBR07868.1 hypothetical protein [Rickettsiales bacterium]HCX22747.1 hypothetical protein [Cytophagales bacterium]
MKKIFFYLLAGMAISYVGCDDDAPEAEDSVEVITKVELIFNPASGGSPIVVQALDDDGVGPNDIEPSGDINLVAGETYELFVSFENTINGEDITEEVEEEGVEHQIFFGFTEGIFSSPEGAGNILSTTGQVNYKDEDDNGLPIGLITSWVVGETSGFGSFRVVLKHQPDIKSATSSFSDGESDVDVSWTINVQ